jgi:hypothetical protein
MSRKLVLCLLALAVSYANGLEKPPFSLEDFGTATGVPANCTASGGGMPSYWVEMTDVSAELVT